MADDGDIKVHEATYHRVLGLLQCGGAVIFVLVLLLIYFALAPVSK
ncbi:aa3-type cytochrome c oxidase subunit IV [Sphingomonas immobilis]|uniref:Aa3-type cytochrome c oxidase subunit IV n=1 Tax=Sphingomonas immobilis TaxID=3063997 RepID=A0ABT9A0Z2_9SPHN|nr:aa3-type cytochrome c oxidase subunit IV [Sphingomonas sp. CA1-15]MDO7843489.1 aa3-type cytochrome c oxidase subunit IV [Sphingomonas sp. CA1-15]